MFLCQQLLLFKRQVVMRPDRVSVGIFTGVFYHLIHCPFIGAEVKVSEIFLLA